MGTPIIVILVSGFILLAVSFYIISKTRQPNIYTPDPSAWLQPPAPVEPELPPAATVTPDYQAQLTEFEQARKLLEASFFKTCSDSGRPRGLRWKNCDFEEDILFVVENHSLNLHALVPVIISFEAIEGGPMEDMEAVGNLRIGSALFVHTGDNWATRGDVIYNLHPQEAYQHYQANYTPFDLASLQAQVPADNDSETPSA